MISRLAVPLALLAAGCSGGEREAPTSPADDARPVRIVSLDLCADQYVLKLVDPTRIAAVSPVAAAPFSYMRDAARGLPTVRATAEDVLTLKPDLVVRAYGGGPNAAAFFERAGVPVLNLGWAADIPAVFAMIESVSAGLGESARGAEVVATMRARLERIASTRTKRTAMYMTPGGVTTGSGSMVHELMVAAGLENFQTQPGWQPIPLERLAYEQPDLVAAAFFQTHNAQPYAWSATRHPIARKQLEAPSVVPIDGAWTACSGWFLLDAVEALAAGPKQ